MRIKYAMFCIVWAIFCPMLSYAQTDSIPLSITFDEEVVITGEYAPTDSRSAIHAIRVIDKKTIERRAAINLEELLQQQLGLRISQDAVLGGQLTMQGLSGKYVKIMIDGVPVIGVNGDNIDLGRIDLSNVERIEIIEGPMSINYGTNALGGTINIITKKYQQKSLSAQLGGQLESTGWYNAVAALGGKWKGITIKGNYTFNHIAGFSTDTLRAQEWNPKTQHIVGALLRKDIGDNFNVQYRFGYLHEQILDKGLLKLATVPKLAYANDYEFFTQTQEHSLGFQGALGKLYYLDGVAAYNWYHRQKNAYTRALLENPNSDEFVATDSDTTDFHAWQLRTTLASQYQKKVNFMLGVDLRYETTTGNRIYDAQKLSNLATIGDYAFFGNIRYQPIEQLILQPSIRWAYNSRYATPFTYGFNLKWDIIKGLQWRMSYARGFRAPNLKELYLDFVDANHFIKGNPNLKAEQSHSSNLVVDYQHQFKDKQAIQLSLSGFYNYIEDQISLYTYTEDSAGNYVLGDNNSLTYSYFNKANYQTWGIGLKVGYQFKNLTIRLQGLMNGQYNQLSAAQKTVPQFNYTLQLTQEITYTLPKHDLSFSLFRTDFDQLIYFSTSYNPITQEEDIVERSLPAYALMDFTITKGFKNRSFLLSAGLKNIMNVTNLRATGGGNTAHSNGMNIPTARGRNFFIKFLYVFKMN